MKPDEEDRIASFGSGIVIPLLGTAYGLFILCRQRTTKLLTPIDDYDAFLWSIQIFALSVVFHAWYFAFYNRHRLIRWSLIIAAVVIGLLSLVLEAGRKLGPHFSK
jgi:cell division protein FtsW (lipid II flippase)